MRGRKINWETVIITLGAAIIVSGSTLGATKITGHQNSRDLDKNLTALAQSSDKAELREVIDQAEVAIVHATSAWVALNEVSPTPPPGGPLRLSATLRAQQRRAVSVFTARVRALDTPLGRLTARLGDRHKVTVAYERAVRGFGPAAFCRRHAPRADSGYPGLDPFTLQAIRYFNATAAHIVGSSLEQPVTATPPSAKDLKDLEKQQARTSGAGQCL